MRNGIDGTIVLGNVDKGRTLWRSGTTIMDMSEGIHQKKLVRTFAGLEVEGMGVHFFAWRWV